MQLAQTRRCVHRKFTDGAYFVAALKSVAVHIYRCTLLIRTLREVWRAKTSQKVRGARLNGTILGAVDLQLDPNTKMRFLGWTPTRTGAAKALFARRSAFADGFCKLSHVKRVSRYEEPDATASGEPVPRSQGADLGALLSADYTEFRQRYTGTGSIALSSSSYAAQSINLVLICMPRTRLLTAVVPAEAA